MQSLFYKLFPTTHFSKAHLEKLQLDASLPLPAPYKLLNNQKKLREYIDWLNKTQQFTLTNNKTNQCYTNQKKKDWNTPLTF